MDTRTRLAEYEKALQEAQVARAAGPRAMRQALGSTPRERLSWLLDQFAYDPDVGRLGEAERYRLWYSLLLLIGDATSGRWAVRLGEWETRETVSARGDQARRARLPKHLRLELEMWRGAPDVEFQLQLGRYRVSAEELRDAQQAVKEAVEGLVSGRLYHRLMPVRVIGRLGPKHLPAPPTPRAKFVLSHTFQAPLRDAAVMAGFALLAEVPPTLIRRCPYRKDPSSTECGRVFVATKRQKWCAGHQDAARRDRDRRAQAESRKRAKTRQQALPRKQRRR